MSATADQIVCCCYGWERQAWDVGPLSLDEYKNGECNRILAKERLFWWYELDLSRRTMVVRDGDPKPQFVVPANLPFRVVAFSFSQIEVEFASNRSAAKAA